MREVMKTQRAHMRRKQGMRRPAALSGRQELPRALCQDNCQDKFLWSDASQTLPTGPNTQQSCDMPPHPVLRLVNWAGAEYNTLTMHSSHLCPRSKN